MKLKPLIIDDLKARVPIIQGGMGIGVSLSSLASAVSKAGGVGVISAAQVGFREPDFEKDNDAANLRGLKKEIQKARVLSPQGILGVNIMTATNNYAEQVKVCVEEKADLIISGAGLPTNLPGLVKDSATKIAPIVSSAKGAKVITKLWTKKYNYLPDLIVVEGPKAGGHLGFSPEVLSNPVLPDLKTIVSEVIEILKPFEEAYGKSIPVIAAGGIYTGKDIAEFIKLGAAGVQMATRFVATDECDAHINFKKAYINAQDDTIKIVVSPLGMPGRAIYNNHVKTVEATGKKIKKCFGCLKACNPATAPYCITEALVKAVEGDVNDGLVFIGSTGCLVDKIVPVEELMDELTTEAEANL
ncbi:MAG: nitronate monooxygenase [Peptostreptococcaceae bacterium]|nr:nitronate monooxygenase [Peptostreptococcaceae bacterium]